MVLRDAPHCAAEASRKSVSAHASSVEIGAVIEQPETPTKSTRASSTGLPAVADPSAVDLLEHTEREGGRAGAPAGERKADQDVIAGGRHLGAELAFGDRPHQGQVVRVIVDAGAAAEHGGAQPHPYPRTQPTHIRQPTRRDNIRVADGSTNRMRRTMVKLYASNWRADRRNRLHSASARRKRRHAARVPIAGILGSSSTVQIGMHRASLADRVQTILCRCTICLARPPQAVSGGRAPPAVRLERCV